MSASYTINAQLDARGLTCPMPLLKAKLALNGLAKGEVLEVLASDSGSWKDIPAYLQQSSHCLLLQEQRGSDYYFLIEKA